MASIPILAAVAAAIIVPVAGTGIYYSVKPSNQEESVQQKPAKTLETPERKPQLSKPNVHGGFGSYPGSYGFTDISGATHHSIIGSSRLDIGRLGTAEESLRQLKERSGQEAQAAMDSVNRVLKGGDVTELSGLRLPSSTTLRVEETHSVSSRSSLTRH